jgi:hypothetical protein
MRLVASKVLLREALADLAPVMSLRLAREHLSGSAFDQHMSEVSELKPRSGESVVNQILKKRQTIRKERAAPRHVG